MICNSHMRSLYPLVPLGMELPHYIRSKPLLYWSTASCIAMPPRYFATLWFIATDGRPPPSRIQVAMFIPFLLGWFTFIVTAAILNAISRPPGPSAIDSPSSTSGAVGLRVFINLLYCMQLGFPVITSSFYRFHVEGGWVSGLMSLLFWFAACLFGVAALLYIAASAKRHSWVSSTLLGGAGIEPMILWLPESGRSYESVGNEAQEGAIQLV